MIATEREYSPAGEEVEVTPALLVVQIRPFAPDIPPVETDGPQHPHKHGINVPGMQLILAALLLVQPVEKIGI